MSTGERYDNAGAQSRSYLVIGTLWVIVFAATSQVMIIAPIIPRISEELGIAESLLGSLMSVYAFAVGLFALITGPISDRFGRRWVLLVGTGLMTLALSLHAFADSFEVLLIVRGIAGAAGGILSGGAISYIGDYFPVNRRGWASGWVMSGMAAGQIAGIPLGNILADIVSFRAPFLAFAIISGLAFLFVLLSLPQPKVERSKQLTLGSALSAYGTLLRRREVKAASTAFLTMMMGIGLYVTYFPTWLEQYLGYTAALVSLLYVVGGVANVIVGPKAGDISDRVGRVRVIIYASIGTAILMPAITFVQPSFSWTVFPLFFITMGLVASRMSPMQALMTQLTTADQRGTLMSLITSIGQIGFGVGSSVAGIAWETYGFLGNAIIAMISVLIMAWIVWYYLSDSDETASPALDPEFVET